MFFYVPFFFFAAAILLAFPDLGLWLACAYLTGDTGRLASLPKTRSMGTTSAVWRASLRRVGRCPRAQ